MLTTLHEVPEGFLDIEANCLHELFDGPTLIHLQGRRPEPVFVSVLLHGNENSGLLVEGDRGTVIGEIWLKQAFRIPSR